MLVLGAAVVVGVEIEVEVEVADRAEVEAPHELLVLDFRRLRLVLAAVEVEATTSPVGLGVHQVLVQLEASDTSEAETVSEAK